MHGNLANFDIDVDGIAIEELSLLNRYVLNEVIRVNKEAQEAYKVFDYQKVTTSVVSSLTNMMSSYYLDYTKDILYIEKEDDRSRREIQTVIYHALMIYSRIMAPILVHTTEELNRVFRPEDESIHLQEFSKLVDPILSSDEVTSMDSLLKLREVCI
ncbi:class I tRNA ligase family protein [Erysipelothrix sp. Poltava]|nr:class I tRNA ligase family protein [Erysipelothrix sp. Poltava]